MVKENDHFVFYGVADGRGECLYGKRGGEIALLQTYEYLSKNWDSFIEKPRYEDELRYEIILGIRSALEKEATSMGVDPDEFASTLVVIAIDKKTQKYTVIHLGDGGIIGLNSEDELSFLSAPMNGITSYYTWTTVSGNAIDHLRILHGSIKHYQKIFLMTDGCERIYKKQYISFRGEQLLLEADAESIERFLLDDKPEDDATLLMIHIEACANEYRK